MSKLLNTVLNKAVVASLLASTCMASSAIAQSEEEYKLEEVLEFMVRTFAHQIIQNVKLKNIHT